jgi:diguanylate cyclase (GGDEF)-like protein
MTRKIALGFGLTILIILVMMVLSYQRTREMVSASGLVIHSNEVLREIKATTEDITEAEAAMRGLLLTDDKSYLEPLQNGATDAPMRLERLRHLTLDNPSQEDRLSALDVAAAEKLDWVADVVRVYERGRREDALAMVRTDAGRLKMDRVRTAAAELENEEKRLLQIRTDAAEVNTRRATTLLRVLAGTTLTILCLAFYFVRTEMHELGRVQRDLADSEEKVKQALQREQELSRVDPLTNVANRRAFYEALDLESRRARRHGRSVALVYVDVDNFKAINDSVGHAAGDALLTTVARVMQTNLRAGSCVGRLGGDEFAILIPEASANQIGRFLDRLRGLLLDEMELHQWPVTFSMGAAVFPKPSGSVEEMIHAADQEMYAVKNRSKNDVSVTTVETAEV